MIEGSATDGWEIACDLCSNSEYVATDTWDELMAIVRKLGWKNRKERGEWINKCPVCVDNEVLNDFSHIK